MIKSPHLKTAEMPKLLQGCHSDNPETTAASGCSADFSLAWVPSSPIHDRRGASLTALSPGHGAHGVTSPAVTPQLAHPHQRAAPCQAEVRRVTADAEIHFAHHLLTRLLPLCCTSSRHFVTTPQAAQQGCCFCCHH